MCIRDRMRSLLCIGIYLGCTAKEGGHTPASEEDADYHHQRNENRRDSGANEFSGRFGGTKPSTGREAAEDAESLQLLQSRCSWFGECGGAEGHCAGLA